MPISWDTRNTRWRWQFKATIGGHRYRFSRLLPASWSEAQARRFDQQETSRTYARLSAGTKPTVPLIEQAVALYLLERIPKQADGKNAAQNLAHMAPYYLGRGLYDLGKVAREYAADAPLAPATVRQRLATLRAAAVHALKFHDIGSKDWIEAMPMPSVDNARHVYLTRVEVLQLARACRDRPTRAWILLTFATGSRPGELFKAEPAGDHFLLPRAKNGDRTSLPVLPRFQRYLRHWPMPHDYTWHSARFREARQAVGLDHVRPHDLRHSMASALANAGATLGEVGHVLNHKTAQATKRYVHFYSDRKLDALSRVWQKRPHKGPKAA